MNTRPIKVAVRRPSGPPNASRLRSAIKQCATFTCAPDDDLQHGGQLLTISDSFHDSLSKDFFEHVFVARPEFDDIYNSIGADRPILIEGILVGLRVFGGQQELYPERAARGIRAFLDSVPARGLADPQRRDRLRKLAEELRRDAEALHED